MLHNMNYLLGAVVSKTHSCFVQRPTCLCNAGHTLAATRALENLIGVSLPEPVRLIRNLAHCLQWLVDHLTYFYAFYVDDWVSPAAAAKASPEATAALARRLGASDPAGSAFYRAAQQELAGRAMAADPGCWPESGGDAFPEASLLVLSHVPAALAVRAELTRAQHLLQGSAAADAAWHVGGLPASAGLRPGSDPDLSPAARAACAGLLANGRRFIEEAFLPDALLLGRLYRDRAASGRTEAFLTWGEFPGRAGEPAFFPGGVFTLGETIACGPASPELVTEAEEPDWDDRDAARYRLRLGPSEPVYRWPSDEFRWFSVPRHAGRACEVGPLARLVGAYGQGNPVVRQLVDAALDRLDVPLSGLNSTLGRVVARGLEAAACIRAATTWLADLDRCLDRADVVLQTPWKLPESGEGVGLAELSRGALIHRLVLADRRIVRHQSLVPSLWNFSPRSGDGRPGPLEQALQAAPVADPDRPQELARIIHTFDPCNACRLRLEDADTGRVFRSNVK